MNFLIKVITVKKKNWQSPDAKDCDKKKKKKKPISEYRGIFFIINKNITSGDCGRIKKGYYNVVYFCIAIYRV